jgi:CheY-like chemotaxis protein
MEPGMDGLETYQQILQRYPGQKAVVASGYAENERVKQILALGVGAYVRKPYSIERLAMAVKEALEREPGGSGTGGPA